MDWIKIKKEHISPTYTLAQIGCMVKFQFLVQELKRMPTQEELYKEIPRKYVVSTEKVLSRYGVDLELISSKVLEDVEKVRSKREVEKQKKRNYRLKQSMSPGTKKDVPFLDKIRLDKIRQDKNILVADKSATPKEEAVTFFERGEIYQKILSSLSEKIPHEQAEAELRKFTLYWTEKNKSGTKQRWEQQPTFEVKRRLWTWLGRVQGFQNKLPTNKYKAGKV